MTLRQIAYLSTRPDHFAETLAYVRHFMPWLTSTVVVTPRDTVAAMTALDAGLTVLADEDVLGPELDSPALDHVTRNFELRLGMCRHEALDDVFLCSDDDYRPLKAITPDRFVRPGPEGRDQLVGYTFYDLLDWTYENTPFDRGQHNMLQVLAYLGADQLAYASHMPQAIDKALLLEAAAIVARVAPSVPVDEWSIHFNLGRKLDPGRFCPPEPYLTLGWPEYPNLWRRSVVPREYAFENFYPQLYEPGHLYAGLPTAFDAARVEQDAVEKLLRWRRLDMTLRRLQLPYDIAVPWTRMSSLRARAYFKALRPALKAMRYLQMGDRAAEDRSPW